MQIKASEISNTKVSAFKSITDRIGVNITLDEFLTQVCMQSDVDYICKEIRHLDYATQHDMINLWKKQLPCATISCLTGKDKSEVIKQNNLLVIDIDLADNPKLSDVSKLNLVKQRLFTLPYVYAVSLSSSGRGIYAIIVTETDDLKGHFRAINEEFKTSGITLDKACTNTNRLRYASKDSEMLKKSDSDVLTAYSKTKQETVRQLSFDKHISDKNMHNVFEEDLYDSKFMKSLVYLIVDKGYRANSYRRWFNDCWRLVWFGDDGFESWLYISKNSDNYDYNELVKKWNTEAPKSQIDLINAVDYFRYWAIRLLGDNWYWLVKAKQRQLEQTKIN